MAEHVSAQQAQEWLQVLAKEGHGRAKLSFPKAWALCGTVVAQAESIAALEAALRLYYQTPGHQNCLCDACEAARKVLARGKEPAGAPPTEPTV